MQIYLNISMSLNIYSFYLILWLFIIIYLLPFSYKINSAFMFHSSLSLPVPPNVAPDTLYWGLYGARPTRQDPPIWTGWQRHSNDVLVRIVALQILNSKKRSWHKESQKRVPEKALVFGLTARERAISCNTASKCYRWLVLHTVYTRSTYTVYIWLRSTKLEKWALVGFGFESEGDVSQQ